MTTSLNRPLVFLSILMVLRMWFYYLLNFYDVELILKRNRIDSLNPLCTTWRTDRGGKSSQSQCFSSHIQSVSICRNNI